MSVEIIKVEFENQPFELLSRLYQITEAAKKDAAGTATKKDEPPDDDEEEHKPPPAPEKPGPQLRPFVEGACLDLSFELVLEVLTSHVNDINFAEEADIGGRTAKIIVELVKRAHADASQRNVCCDAMKVLHAFTPAGKWEKIQEVAASRRLFDAAAARIRKVATSGREKELGVDVVTALSTLVLHYDAECEALGRAELLQHLRTIKPLAGARPMPLPPEPKKAKAAPVDSRAPPITLAAVAAAIKAVKKGEKVTDALVRAVFAKLAGEPNPNTYACAARKLWEFSRADDVGEAAEAQKKLAQAIGTAYEANRAKFLPDIVGMY
jgi:hypothetical protein